MKNKLEKEKNSKKNEWNYKEKRNFEMKIREK